mmetsp:Transcript_47782/g.144505  ORF Transcript_47782/g.144505 Transcript_47782/m.144505 type:complete len:230 (+) Transcript_47782:1339-2028(+)
MSKLFGRDKIVSLDRGYSKRASTGHPAAHGHILPAANTLGTEKEVFGARDLPRSAQPPSHSSRWSGAPALLPPRTTASPSFSGWPPRGLAWRGTTEEAASPPNRPPNQGSRRRPARTASTTAPRPRPRRRRRCTPPHAPPPGRQRTPPSASRRAGARPSSTPRRSPRPSPRGPRPRCSGRDERPGGRAIFATRPASQTGGGRPSTRPKTSSHRPPRPRSRCRPERSGDT